MRSGSQVPSPRLHRPRSRNEGAPGLVPADVRLLAALVLLLLTAGCATAAVPPQTVPSTPSTPSSGATGATAAATPAPPPPVVVVLLKDFIPLGGAPTYSLSLVDVKGNLLASATAHHRTRDWPMISPISTVADRVYYLDGDSDLRYLRPDGSTAAVRRLAVPDGFLAAFSVSPDRLRVAVSLVDLRAPRFSTTLSVEDLSDGANHVELFSGPGNEWPIGWHQGSLVVAVGSPGPPQNTWDALIAAREFHVADPATGARIHTICGPGQAVLLNSAGVSCNDNSGHVYSWSGTSQTVPKTSDCIPSGPLSPDGNALVVAGCKGVPFSIVKLTGEATPTAAVGSGTAVAWLDANHILVESRAPTINENYPLVIFDLASGKSTNLPPGYFAAGLLTGTL